MQLVNFLLLILLLIGHVALWIAAFNRLHAMNIPARWVRIGELVQIALANVLLLYLANRLWPLASESPFLPAALLSQGVVGLYSLASLAFALFGTAQWVYRRTVLQNPPQLVSNHGREIDVERELGFAPAQGWSTRLFCHLPMNQMFDLCVNEKILELPRLATELDGLTITHLSDLHFTGKVTRPFFDRVIDEAVELQSDLVAITGDIQEVEACYAWLRDTLGRLRAPLGVYFVLGNHDKRLREPGRLRRELAELGMVDVATSPQRILHRGRSLVLAGNELPWFRPVCEPPARQSAEEFRMLLSHTPDQIRWGREHDFDLMLAGHTHGGHIRLPVFGPIVCPSRYGVKYASGTFFEAPTLMHVSRGISGLDPLRFNCPPELTRLVLRRPGSISAPPSRSAV